MTEPDEEDGGGLVSRAADIGKQVRRRQPWLDHLIRAVGRYLADGGNDLAASVTYFGFLSLFPLLLILFAVLGFVTRSNSDINQRVLDAIAGYLPSTNNTNNTQSLLTQVQQNAAAASATAIPLLIYTGLGWVDAMRRAFRTIWHHNFRVGNLFYTKLRDLIFLGGLALALAITLGLNTVVSAAGGPVLRLLHLDGNAWGAGLLLAAGYLVSLVGDVLIMMWLFYRLPKTHGDWRHVARGVVFAGVGLFALQTAATHLGSLIIGSKTSTYGYVGLVIGVLVWINVLARFTLFAAAWTVTAPYDSDVPPSGSSSVEYARRAGIPERFVHMALPDDPLNLYEGGAPSPMLQGLRTGNETWLDEDEIRHEPRVRTPRDAPPEEQTGVPPDPPPAESTSAD